MLKSCFLLLLFSISSFDFSDIGLKSSLIILLRDKRGASCESSRSCLTGFSGGRLLSIPVLQVKAYCSQERWYPLLFLPWSFHFPPFSFINFTKKGLPFLKVLSKQNKPIISTGLLVYIIQFSFCLTGMFLLVYILHRVTSMGQSPWSLPQERNPPAHSNE